MRRTTKNGFDENAELPVDKSYMERDLPSFLRESIEQMIIVWEKRETGDTSRWERDYCELQSNINVAEDGDLISSEQAWYLREKYLRIKRSVKS